MQEICVIGAGYVGATTSVLLASLGHRVTVCEVDSKKLQLLQNGILPIYEPGLQEYLVLGLKKGNLTFTGDLGSALSDASFVFICVPTPSLEDGSADMSFVLGAAKNLADKAKHGAIVITKSTVPVGSADELLEVIDRDDIQVVSNPEFLREGNAVNDFLKPDRIVIGSTNDAAAQKVANLYTSLGAHVIITDPKSAELIKYASNSFLAMKLSFVNEIARLCDAVGASSQDVIGGFGLDTRIGSKFTQTGPGWGGSCFPKDTRALTSLARSRDIDLQMVDAAIASNLNAKLHVVRLLRKILHGELRDRKIAVWGLAFKAFTDDTRESPALHICELLIEQGCKISAFDPKVGEIDLAGIELSPTALDATIGADALLILTEWPIFSEQIPGTVLQKMAGNSILDTRGILNSTEWRDAGANLKALGNSMKKFQDS